MRFVRRRERLGRQNRFGAISAAVRGGEADYALANHTRTDFKILREGNLVYCASCAGARRPLGSGQTARAAVNDNHHTRMLLLYLYCTPRMSPCPLYTFRHNIYDPTLLLSHDHDLEEDWQVGKHDVRHAYTCP